MKQHAGVGSKTPVLVLARAVDACERLLVEQHAEAMTACHLLHERHEEHVMVDGDVGLLEDWRQLELVGSSSVQSSSA